MAHLDLRSGNEEALKAPILIINLIKGAKSNTPEILTALGVGGVLGTSYLTGKASYEMGKEEDVFPDSPLSNKERLKQHWKKFIPPAIFGALTIGCIIGSNRAGSKKVGAAVAAYSVSEKAFSEYKEKVVEEIGEKKEQRLRDELAQRRIDNVPPVARDMIITGAGDVWCCELFTHRYFKSDMEAIRQAVNVINHKINNELYVTMGEFYDLIGLEQTSNSDQVGWNSDKLLELEFHPTMTKENIPCIAFNYNYVKTDL